MKKLLRLAPIALIVVGMMVATFGSTTAQDDELVFTMVAHGGSENPFWVVAIKGMEDACAMLEADCVWLNEGDSNEAMGALWDDALARPNDGIGTTAPNPEVIRDPMERAAELDIPVIIFNAQDPNQGTPDALPALFYIGASEFLGGRSNAQRVIAEAAEDGVTINRAVCPIQEVGHTGLEGRCAGVESVFNEFGIPVDRLTINNDVTESAGTLADYFTANPDTNALFLLGPNPASSFNLYIQESGLEPGEIYATTHDTGATIYQMIQDGYLLQAIDQQQYLQGFETIMWLYLNSQFALAPGSDILTGPGVIDASNVDQVIELTAAGYR